MKILKYDHIYPNGSVDAKVRMGEPEISQLRGSRDQICMISNRIIKIPSKSIKTGARHYYTKWMLLPAKLRKKFSGVEYDYENMKVGSVKYKNYVLIVHKIREKGMPSIEEENGINNTDFGQIIKYFILKIFLTLLILISISV